MSTKILGERNTVRVFNPDTNRMSTWVVEDGIDMNDINIDRSKLTITVSRFGVLKPARWNDDSLRWEIYDTDANQVHRKSWWQRLIGD